MLCRYVAVILQRAAAPRIVDRVCERSSYRDQGYEVCREICRYCFEDGTLICRTEEHDEFPDAAVCAECWITYEVLATGNGGPVEPLRKTFENACRESFWLSYHLA